MPAADDLPPDVGADGAEARAAALTAGRTVAEVGEDALVAAVVARLRALSGSSGSGSSGSGSSGSGGGGCGPARVLVGPGDDAAVLELDGPLVTSTDTLVEGVDFRTDWSTAQEIGRKAAVQVLADVEAMGAVPVGILVSLVVPGRTRVDWCVGLADGLAAEAHRADVQVLGGDVADGGALVVTGTSFGVLVGPAGAVGRDGARPGDVVALGGAGPAGLGASAAGLALLLAGHGRERDALAVTAAGVTTVGDGVPEDDERGGDAAVARALATHRAPSPDHTAGPRARAAGAGALIDISDGLVRDATRVARASGVVLDLAGDALRPGPDLLAVAARLGSGPADAQEWVLTSGEEHAMLACFPAEAVLPDGFVAVGAVRPSGPGGPGVSVDGIRREGAGGWTHYGRRP